MRAAISAFTIYGRYLTGVIITNPTQDEIIAVTAVHADSSVILVLLISFDLFHSRQHNGANRNNGKNGKYNRV